MDRLSGNHLEVMVVSTPYGIGLVRQARWKPTFLARGHGCDKNQANKRIQRAAAELAGSNGTPGANN